MQTINRNRALLFGGLSAAIIFSGGMILKNRSLNKEMIGTKIVSEALYSEKLNLDKSVARFKNDLNAANGKNAELDKKIAGFNQQLDTRQRELNKLIAENVSLRSIKVKMSELKQLYNKLNTDLITQRSDYDKLKSENSNLSGQLAQVSKDRDELVANNKILRALSSNNHRIEAVRGKNNKLMVRACRAQKLILSFDLPGNVAGNLSFKIVTPDGKQITTRDNKSSLVNISETKDNFFAQVKELGVVGTKQVELVYLPSEKLSKGVYKFEVYKDSQYIGSSAVRLR
jgi:hypothetical protein